MRVIYSKPELKDLSQGSRIAFIRQFRYMTQDEVSDKLGLTGECKRRTMTRYEIDISKVPKVNKDGLNVISSFLNEWDTQRKKRLKQEISYEEYIE